MVMRHDLAGAKPLAARFKESLNTFTIAVQQFWEGYLQSPNGC